MGRWRKKRGFQLPLGGAESVVTVGPTTLFNSDALSLYGEWGTPCVIVSDGPYGVSTFFGDVPSYKALPAWYEPHVRVWSEMATPQTTLWFWCTEIGWATVHPVLDKYGWTYVNCHVWDKGINHIAGNSNTKSLRELPIVTEVCVQYVKEARINGVPLQDWLRQEWQRSGLALSATNSACGVRNAATRKYFTSDRLWYFPPPDKFEQLALYANEHGRPDGRPYFAINGRSIGNAKEWAQMRAKFHCKPGVTNVWREPPLQGPERIRIGGRSAHLNQKPLKLVELIIELSSDPGDLVWEPFGGLCTAAVAAYRLGRKCVSAETDNGVFALAAKRLRDVEAIQPTREQQAC